MANGLQSTDIAHLSVGLQGLLENAKTELNLNEGGYAMWVSDMPVAPAQTSSVMVIAQTNQMQARANKSGHVMGVCSLVTANQGQATSGELNPAMNATGYFNYFDKNNKLLNIGDPRVDENNKRLNFDDARLSVIQKPKHGRLTNDVWNQVSGEYVALPVDAKISDLNRYRYIPNEGYEGKDFAVVQAEKNGVKVSIYYFLHITVEVNAQYRCERKEGLWKISQSDFDSGSQN